jgi:phosphatidylserine/phosphatidylglycerophosphate/cardiolipin synthase-like enzyme
MTDLAEAVALAAETLGEAHLRALSTAYRGTGLYSVSNAGRALAAVPPNHAPVVDRVNVAWANADSTGAAIALALEAVVADRRITDRPHVEVVVTGPDTPAVPVRLTSEVVRQLIDRAKDRVTLVSFSAYRVQAVVDALDQAAARGVGVRLILESPENLKEGGGAHAYKKHPTYRWPLDKRVPPDALLHAKAVIVDSREVLITSANMTNTAYDKSIELGLICSGGGIADQVQRHFDSLITRGVLELVP